MSGQLPNIVNRDGIRKLTTVTFGGYRHTVGAGDGDLYDMKNMSGRYYPVLAPRKKRCTVRSLTAPNGICAHDGIYTVDGTAFQKNGVTCGKVTDGAKQMVSIGSRIVIFPDKAYYDSATDTFGSLESTWNGAGKIQNGTYAEEEAAANTIYAADTDWSQYFRVGDAVTISGCTVHPENNRTPVIREIDGAYLRFYENVFVIDEGGDIENNLTIARKVPDMDFLCENENRLWGCCGDTIYASKLGDPFNFNVFDGLSTDSYAVGVGSAGDFTACCSYLGYPVFFKEDHIYKVYGAKPSNFQVMRSATRGVMTGSGGSLAVAGEMLFYLSSVGIMSYSGGMPQSVHDAFGEERYRNAVGGSDGERYYISMQDSGGRFHLFVYDTRTGLWHREDKTHAVGFCFEGGLYCLCADGTLFTTQEDAVGTVEETVTSMCEFADFTAGSPNHKGITKLQLRVEIEPNAVLRVEIMYDSNGIWQTVQTLAAQGKTSCYLPVIPRRCDHFRIRLSGQGEWKLYSLTCEQYIGSEHRA